jgi:hypothetical protein
VLGLNLLRLLVQNRTAEFHTQLELLPPDAHASAHVKHAVALEQHIMEGAYNKVLAARGAVPDASYAWFMDALAETVRDEIGACAEAAYASLSLAAAQALLRLDTPAQLAAFVAKARPSRPVLPLRRWHALFVLGSCLPPMRCLTRPLACRSIRLPACLPCRVRSAAGWCAAT